MDKKILTWSQVVNLLKPNTELSLEKDFSTFLTRARQSGIGEPISFQKTAYSDQDLAQVAILLDWLQLLNQSCIPEFRDKNTNTQIQNAIIKSLISKNPLTIYSVYCPSYKKGNNAFGYTGKVGNHTLNMMHSFFSFVAASNRILPTRGVAYFSDLLLENYKFLQNTPYKADLLLNFQDFREKFLSIDSLHLIETKLLSSISELRLNIGEAGITSGEIPLPDNVYKIVESRNRIFYKNELGWTESQIQERTNVLARCYSYMGNIFRQLFPNSIMFWTESAYERGRMYSGLNQDSPLPIIYPYKDTNAT